MPASVLVMSAENNNGNFNTSQINQSEAGPDIVQLENEESSNKINDTRHVDLNDTKPNTDMFIRQPVNVVAPLKVEGRGAHQAVLELELSKLHEMLEKQDRITQQRVIDSENQLAQRFNQLCSVQEKVKLAEEKERNLLKKMGEQTQNYEQLKVVMQDYEMLIGKLMTEVEEAKQMKEKLSKIDSEKEAAIIHLGNVEAAFSDVHIKYEKCKKVVEEYRRNDSTMKELISELRETVRIREKTLESVQIHAGKQLDAAQREQEQTQREYEMEITRLRAMLRKTELKVISLQESIDQKVKENHELTTICDDLIAGKRYSQN